METNRDQLIRVKDFIFDDVPPQYRVGVRDASENTADLAIKVIRRIKYENAGFRKDIQISGYDPEHKEQLDKLAVFISGQIKDPNNDKTVVDTTIDLIEKLQVEMKGKTMPGSGEKPAEMGDMSHTQQTDHYNHLVQADKSNTDQFDKIRKFIAENVPDDKRQSQINLSSGATMAELVIEVITAYQKDNTGLNHDVDVQDEACRGLFYREIADCLPDEFIYWCGMKMLVHATTDENETSDPSAMTFADAFKLWEQRKK